MSVEHDNPRAKILYERLGYKGYGHEQESWDEEDASGNVSTYIAEVTLLKKFLS